MPTEDAYSSGHLVLSHFGTCMCSNVETNLSWTCLVSWLLNFEHPSVLLFCSLVILPYSRVFYYPLALSHGVCGIWIHPVCPYYTTTPADLSGCTIDTISLYHARSILVVLLQVHVDCQTWSIVSLFLWHVHLCWAMHSVSHSHCIMDYYGSVMLWTRVVYISYATGSWCPLHLCLTCSINALSLCSTGLIWWLCHRHMLITYRIVWWCLWRFYLFVLCFTIPGWLIYIRLFTMTIVLLELIDDSL